jgi:hypothetical protein
MTLNQGAGAPLGHSLELHPQVFQAPSQQGTASYHLRTPPSAPQPSLGVWPCPALLGKDFPLSTASRFWKVSFLNSVSVSSARSFGDPSPASPQLSFLVHPPQHPAGPPDFAPTTSSPARPAISLGAHSSPRCTPPPSTQPPPIPTTRGSHTHRLCTEVSLGLRIAPPRQAPR